MRFQPASDEAPTLRSVDDTPGRAGTFFRRRTSKRRLLGCEALSLLELTIVIAMLLVLAAIALPWLRGAITMARNARAIGDIRAIEADLLQYYYQFRTWPDNLNEVGHGERRDPWGNAYKYLSFALTKGKGDMRKDRFLVPLNSDYDLYSSGPDGESRPPLTAPQSYDDIIRANDGGYVGLASLY